MRYLPYDKNASFGYAPGVFPSLELLSARPDAVRALLYRPEGDRNAGVSELMDRCRAMGIRVEEAPRAIERIAGKENCYAVAAFEKYEDRLGVRADHVVLCGISDMGNLGAIIRSCLGFFVQDIAVITPAADHFHPRVVRASMGAVFRARIACFKSFGAYEAAVGQRTHYFFRLQNAVPLPVVVRASGPVSLVFGNEAAGLAGPLLARDIGVLIPQSGQVDSLNLSVAVGIGLYALGKTS